jgi:hypothetical protein
MSPSSSSSVDLNDFGIEKNEPKVAAYFEKIISTRLGNPGIVCGFAGPSKGKGIYASKDFQAGMPLWTERPFVSMQHQENMEEAPCCQNCYVPLRSYQQEWNELRQTTNRFVENPVHDEDLPALLSLVEATSNPKEYDPANSYYRVFDFVPNTVECECGFQYCTEKCRQEAFDDHHALLCIHRSVEMAHFIQHAHSTNEIFELAAKVLAKIIMKFITKGQDVVIAREPVDMFCKMPWWQVISSEEDLEEGQTMEEYQEMFKDILRQTLGHLMEGLRGNLECLQQEDYTNGLEVDLILHACADILNVDFFADIVGMFEMNNISMEIDHPFQALLEQLHDLEFQEKDLKLVIRTKKALEKFQELKDQYHDLDDDDHEQEKEKTQGCCGSFHAFPGIEGTALFSVICTMNHSCVPNCTVLYTKDGSAHVFAVKEIKVSDLLQLQYCV